MCLKRIGTNYEMNYKKQLSDNQCMKLSKLAYESMVISEKIIKKINSQLTLVKKHIESKNICPNCNQNIRIPDTTTCFDCFIKNKSDKTLLQVQPLYNSTIC
jgi:hypothetical protein